MPFEETTIVDWREQMVMQLIKGQLSVSEATRVHGVSRPTVRLWRDRYLENGRSGLVDRSHAPHSCPHRISREIEEFVVADREKYNFGSKKILRRLRMKHPDLQLGRSTVDAILVRNGLVKQQQPRPKTRSPFGRPFVALQPGDLDTMDHKGQFRMLNGRYCYALTIMDAFSRRLLACEALHSTALKDAWPVIQRVFREHGLPLAVHTDNGPPFGATHGRLSTLSVRLMKIGVQPVFSRPGKPQDNGAHERMHRDLKARTTRPPGRDRTAQQKRFDEFQQIYNFERPHEGIDFQLPAALHKPSPRPYPTRVNRPEYPTHFEKRKVDKNGTVKWNTRRIFLADALKGETVALEAVDDQVWTVYYHNFFIATFDEKKKRFI